MKKMKRKRKKKASAFCYVGMEYVLLPYRFSDLSVDSESAVFIDLLVKGLLVPVKFLTNSQKAATLIKSSSTEILEYSSDSEKEVDSENVLFIDSESPHKYHMEFGLDTRQVIKRLIDPGAESTETVLYTPQKRTPKYPRTPESSTKKKLLRGGLAERLSGLQNRERSAISLWRHQCVPYQKTLSGRKSCVLTVKILELHEECTMQVAMCEQLLGPPATSPSCSVAPRPGASLRVLFTKETAGHLRGRPQDIVHIFPPWQKLIIPNGSYPVILNTHFCEKVVPKEDSEITYEKYHQDIPLPRRSITLAQIFRIKGLTNNSPEIQVVCSGAATMGTSMTHQHEEARQHIPTSTPLRDSLLDVVESQGAAPWLGAGVRVVVQRMYSLPGKDSTRGQQGCSSGHTDPLGARMTFFDLLLYPKDLSVSAFKDKLGHYVFSHSGSVTFQRSVKAYLLMADSSVAANFEMKGNIYEANQSFSGSNSYPDVIYATIVLSLHLNLSVVIFQHLLSIKIKNDFKVALHKRHGIFSFLFLTFPWKLLFLKETGDLTPSSWAPPPPPTASACSCNWQQHCGHTGTFL
ncbi:DNA repair-scaffolding protein-like [Carlito syrichta]|uniref:DNA repair-scaffolding protein-like n=1 Tax=Carlito syrichta TaxID=1868482 RepID=A0A3Q0EDQ2_CARSF|nr:DNA repair-scaffolding protein-like [Carlito syrichta]